MALKEREISNWILNYEGKDIKVKVPGDISNDLYINGIIDNPYWADNFKSLDWIHQRDWEYKTEFEITNEDIKSEQIYIKFEGIDTYSEIFVNDAFIGETHNMFRSFCFDLKPYLKVGHNILMVKIKSVRKILDKYDNEDKYVSSFNKNRIFLRKVQCHFGWDWCPDFPGTGIYLPVKLCYGDLYNIENVKIDTFVDGTVNFTVKTQVNNRKEPFKNFEGVLRTEIISNNGEVFVSEKKLFGSINSLVVKVENPQLWFPNGYGEQILYKYKVSLIKDDVVLDEKNGRFGIREVKIDEPLNADGSRGFNFFVNGTRIRCVGGNWVPISSMTGAIADDRYFHLIKTANGAGLNMLRVWGGGFYEKNIFYDLCDEFGILVWQDFMFSCETVPDDDYNFREEVFIEAVEQVKRLRNHPSILLWCAGNEISDSFSFDERKCGRYISKIMLAGIVAEHDGNRRYLSNSPYTVSDIGNDISSGDCHRNAQGIASFKDDLQNFRKYQQPNMNNFDSECAMLGMCRLRSFKKFMPEDKLYPQNDLWKERLLGNPHDFVLRDFTERLKFVVDSLFGEANTIEDFIKKSMIAHAEILGAEVDYFRSYKRNSGILSWMFNDNCGNGTWSVVDDEIEAKPALYALKRAGKRLRVSITEEPDGFYVNVINDTKNPYVGDLIVSHERISGKALFSESKAIKVDAFTQIKEKITFNSDEKDCFLYAEIKGDYCIFFYDMWKDKKFISDIEVDKRVDGNNATITVKANSFARTVFIDLPEKYFPILSDNYFDLKAGASKSVTVTAEQKIKPLDIKVYTFADTWVE